MSIRLNLCHFFSFDRFWGEQKSQGKTKYDKSIKKSWCDSPHPTPDNDKIYGVRVTEIPL